MAREMGLARFGKLSIDGTKVRANASRRKAMSYGARGGAALEGGGRSVAEHGSGCGGGRTLWRVVARGRVARRVAPSRGSAGGDCCGEGACSATRGARVPPGVGASRRAAIAANPRTRRRTTSPTPTVPRPAPKGSSNATTRRWRGEHQLIVATDEQCKRPRAGLRGQGDLRRAARDGACGRRLLQ